LGDSPTKMACCNFLLKKIGIEKQTIWDKIDVLLGTSLKTQWELDGKGLEKKKNKTNNPSIFQ